MDTQKQMTKSDVFADIYMKEPSLLYIPSNAISTLTKDEYEVLLKGRIERRLRAVLAGGALGFGGGLAKRYNRWLAAFAFHDLRERGWVRVNPFNKEGA